MSEYFNCLYCGKPAVRNSSRQIYCPRCRAEREREYKRETARKKREERQRAATPLDAPMIRCEACGGLTPGGRNRKYCPACAKKRARERMEAANAGRYRYTPNKKPQAEEVKRHYTRPRRTGLLFDLGGKELSEVALEAKTLGMSYGEYTSACFGGTIERKLAMQGVSREAAGHMIANAKRKKTLAKKKKADAAP